MQQSTFWSEEHPASLSVSQDSEQDWTTRVATSCSPILQLLRDIGPHGWYGRTSPACYPVTEAAILLHYFEGWQNAGMGSPTEFLTLSTSEHNATPEQCHKDGGVCSLSDILEVGNVPRRYYLSAKACQGILRRAEKRGKELPPALSQALSQLAESDTITKPCSAREATILSAPVT
jgi:hypothetical protein